MSRIVQSAGMDTVEWGMVEQTLPGETDCGDAALVVGYPGGCLVAVADGLGHGVEAADAAQRAMNELRVSPSDSILAQMARCHEALRDTRGAVLSLAAFNFADHTLSWAGVGNVVGVLTRARAGEFEREHLLCRGGTIGAYLPPLYAGMMRIFPGDTLVLHTDGVHPEGMDTYQHWLQPPQKIADDLMREGWRANDDALVLVARYLAGAPR